MLLLFPFRNAQEMRREFYADALDKPTRVEAGAQPLQDCSIIARRGPARASKLRYKYLYNRWFTRS
jgi:hypothetical protein